MIECMGIQEVAELTGVTAHTLRYYEQAELMLEVPRDGGGRRLYSAVHVRWVRFIRRLRSGGMPISEVRRYVQWTIDGTDENGVHRLTLLAEHRSDVTARLAELTEHLRVLDEKLASGCAPDGHA